MFSYDRRRQFSEVVVLIYMPTAAAAAAATLHLISLCPVHYAVLLYVTPFPHVMPFPS